jgi:peptidyl-prolyl cis-trans isomerase B (cyclophilin B)
VSPTKREREYAKRRYSKWQEKQAVIARQRREAQRRALLAVLAVAATLGVVGAVLVYGPYRTPSSTEAAAPETSAGATAGASATADADNPCPAPSDATPADLTWPTPPPASLAEKKSWTLAVETTCGPVSITLDGAAAPQAVASTIFLARNAFYDNTPCHRLTTGGIFVLQCGDPTGTGGGGPGYSYGPVENAPADDLYPAGTVAMARQQNNGSSMGSQLFLVYQDSTISSDAAGGYTVVGKITSGLDTVQKVAAGGITGTGGDGAPARKVSITSTKVS